METLQTIWKFSRHSGNFPEKFVTCQKIWKLSMPSILPEYTENFLPKPKNFRQFKNVQDNLETFQTIQKLFRNFSDFLDKFRMKKNKSMFSAKTFWTRKNFPGSNAPALPTYFCLCVYCIVMDIKNPTYGRHRISRPMRIIAPIFIFKIFFTQSGTTSCF